MENQVMLFRNKRHQHSPETARKVPVRESRTATFAIREAERLISAGEYERALERLSTAQKLDPENKYIMAIIDRIGGLQTHRPIGDRKTAKPSASKGGRESARYLGITVGSEFENGVFSGGGTAEENPADVRALTMSAEIYLKQGLLNKAFEQLMQAYLLDPVHPAVMACEQHILPSWEKARRRNHTAGF
jgi:tetratricopeptide (TPR) repeat protein